MHNSKELHLMGSRRQFFLAALGASAAIGASDSSRIVEFTYPMVDAAGTVRRDPGRCVVREEDLGGGVALSMTDIPGGEFTMGSEDVIGRPGILRSTPLRRVAVSPFQLGTFPLTRSQWRRVAALPRVSLPLRELVAASERLPDSWPVDVVGSPEAEEVCARLRRLTGKPYRLPSEAEWEYACRAGTRTRFHFGDQAMRQFVNFTETLPRGTLSVPGSLNAPNRFGLHDMHGNVAEWCADHVHPDYTGAPSDARSWVTGGDARGRIQRGGSYVGPAELTYAATRNEWPLEVSFSGAGMRPALDGQASRSDPVLSASGVTHAASLAAGPVCPGAILSLFGTALAGVQEAAPLSGGRLPIEHAGTGVVFGDRPGRVLFVSPTQVNAVVPFGIEGREVPVFVVRDGQSSSVVRLEVMAAAPEVFTVDGSGVGLVVAARSDWTMVSRERPLAAGEVAALFGTGAGAMTPVPDDGSVIGNPLPRFVSTADVEIGGRAAEVLYFGPAPGLVAGVFQLNIRVPGGLSAGDAQVRLRVGGVASRAAVLLPVQ